MFACNRLTKKAFLIVVTVCLLTTGIIPVAAKGVEEEIALIIQQSGLVTKEDMLLSKDGAAISSPSELSHIHKMYFSQQELSISAGDIVDAPIVFEPSDGTKLFVQWFSSDVNVVSVNPLTFELEAHNPGQAMVFAYTEDSQLTAWLKVDVSGEWDGGKDISNEDSAPMQLNLLLELSDAELAKVTDRKFLSFVEMVKAASDWGIRTFEQANVTTFRVIVGYSNGRRADVEMRLSDLGISGASFFNTIPFFSVSLTAEQMALLLNEADLVTIVNTDQLAFADANPILLEGNVDTLSKISIPQEKGLLGQNAYVAILDTGLNSDHPEFSGRVAYEKCFSAMGNNEARNVEEYEYEGLTLYKRACPSCRGTGSEALGESDSARPYWDFKLAGGEYPYSYWTHGSHVAGIAAGKNGVAQQAEIVAVNIFTQFTLDVQKPDGTFLLAGFFPASSYTSDIISGLLYVSDLKKNQGVNIKAVNLSLGGGQYYQSEQAKCDEENFAVKYVFDELLATGIIPVVAAGNDGMGSEYDGWINGPACISNAFAVGALDDNPQPEMASYSNLNDMVEINAPGTNLYSSILTFENTNPYASMSGTSMATPMVAGAITLLSDHQPRGVDVRDYLLNLARSSTGREVGGTMIRKRVLDLSNFKVWTRWGTWTDWREQKRVLPGTGFPAGKVTPLSIETNITAYQPLNYSLEIPQLDLHTEIYQIPWLDGAYDVERLGADAGLLEGSALPGEGLSVIAAHNHLNTAQSGPFLFLRDLADNSRLFVRKPDGNILPYRVYANLKMAADDYDTLEANSKENALVLVTCEDELAEGGYAFRRVVFAEPL